MALDATVRVLSTLSCLATTTSNCLAADLPALPMSNTCPNPKNKGDSAAGLLGKTIAKGAVVSPLDDGPPMLPLKYQYKKVWSG